MRTRVLGRTGIKVSEIALGTAEIGFPYGIGVSTQAQMPAEDEAVKLLEEALDNGINCFDTARGYGRSEEVLGRTFRNRRADVVICTKCLPLYRDNGELPAAAELRALIADSLRESLSALQTDYIDVYMIHNRDLVDNQQVADIFSEYKRKGVVRAIGASIYTVEETKKAIQGGVWDVVQLPFNLMDQRQGAVLSLARQSGLGVIVRSALMKGILTDKGRNLFQKLDCRHPKFKAIEEHRDRYQRLLSEKITTLPDLAVKFVLSHKDISSVLIGTGRIANLRKALAAAGDYLDDNTLARARELAYPEPDFLDLGKWRAMGWLK